MDEKTLREKFDWENPSIDQAYVEDLVRDVIQTGGVTNTTEIEKAVGESLWETLELDEAYHDLATFNALVALYVGQSDVDHLLWCAELLG